MKTTLLMLSAAGLFLVAGASHAGPREVQAYLDDASARASAQLAAEGVHSDDLRVKARIGSDGRVHTLSVSGATSLEAELKARQALRGLKVDRPPAELAGRAVRLAVGPSPVLQAKAR